MTGLVVVLDRNTHYPRLELKILNQSDHNISTQLKFFKKKK